MPRALRIEFEGAVNHVMARGQRRTAIVLDDEDRQRWTSALAEAVQRSDWKVLAYALMGNHLLPVDSRHLYTGAVAATSRLLSGAPATDCSNRQTANWIIKLQNYQNESYDPFHPPSTPFIPLSSLSRSSNNVVDVIPNTI